MLIDLNMSKFKLYQTEHTINKEKITHEKYTQHGLALRILKKKKEL